jgi:uncharacterized beta-barrel protein YwiB (DUF1934 family)
MIPVQIAVKTIIQETGRGGRDEIFQKATGFLKQTEDHWWIQYKEKGEDGETTITTIHSTPEKIVIHRQGSVSYRHAYQVEQKTISMVSTPAGKLEMEVYTERYQRNGSGSKGSILLGFHLILGKQAIGSYEVEIQWEKFGEK